MFFRRKQPAVTNESYVRWLRAQQPPWLFFLGLDAESQEQLAILGDEHATERALDLAFAIADPAGAEAGVDATAGGLEGEETLARRVATALIERVAAKTVPAAPIAPPVEMPRETLAGIGKRREAIADADRFTAAAKNARRSLFGREPDKAEAR